MYVLANLGVIRHYRGKARAQFNPVTHLVFPVISTVAVLYVGYKSIVPLPDPPARYALFLFLAYTALGGGVLVYLKSRGREDWLTKAGLAMEESERGGAPSAVVPATPESPARPDPRSPALS